MCSILNKLLRIHGDFLKGKNPNFSKNFEKKLNKKNIFIAKESQTLFS